MNCSCPKQETLDNIFPKEKTDIFFNALYGEAEEGAYDIRLICRQIDEELAHFAFELTCRPGKCLRCNLTYGLPQVFQRHPVIDAAGTAKKLADAVGWPDNVSWTIGATEETSTEKHFIPFTLKKMAASSR